MQDLCHEVRRFITACEDIHSLLSKGDVLTADEKGVIEFSVLDLLTKVTEKARC